MQKLAPATSFPCNFEAWPVLATGCPEPGWGLPHRWPFIRLGLWDQVAGSTCPVPSAPGLACAWRSCSPSSVSAPGPIGGRLEGPAPWLWRPRVCSSSPGWWALGLPPASWRDPRTSGPRGATSVTPTTEPVCRRAGEGQASAGPRLPPAVREEAWGRGLPADFGEQLRMPENSGSPHVPLISSGQSLRTISQD